MPLVNITANDFYIYIQERSFRLTISFFVKFLGFADIKTNSSFKIRYYLFDLKVSSEKFCKRSDIPTDLAENCAALFCIEFTLNFSAESNDALSVK